MININIDNFDYEINSIVANVGNIKELDYKLKLTDEDRKKINTDYLLEFNYNTMNFYICPVFYKTQAVLNKELEIDNNLNKLITKYSKAPINSFLSSNELNDIVSQFKEQSIAFAKSCENKNFETFDDVIKYAININKELEDFEYEDI
jgi:hypothetical protein